MLEYIIEERTNLSKDPMISYLIFTIYFLLPFERIPTLEIAGFTLKLSYLAFLIFLAAILLTFKKSKTVIFSQRKTSDYFLLAFWLWSGLTVLSSPDKTRSLIIFFLWLFIFLVYYLLSRFINNRKIKDQTENIILITTVLVCLFGLYQYVGDSLGLPQVLTGLRDMYVKGVLGYPRIQSVALEPLYFSNFLLVPFFLALAKYFQNNNSSKYGFVLLLILVNIILGISRGAYIALGVTALSFLIYIIFIRKEIEKFSSKLVSFCLIIFVSLVMSAGLIYGLNGKKAASSFVRHSNAAEELQVTQSSAGDRLGTYGLALNFFKKNPVAGKGLGSFGSLTTSNETKSSGYGTVNNEYLEILCETGLIGIILFLLFLGFAIAEIWQSYKVATSKNKLSILCLTLGCLAIFIQYNFFSTLYIIYIWAFLALLKSYNYDSSK